MWLDAPLLIKGCEKLHIDGMNLCLDTNGFTNLLNKSFNVTSFMLTLTYLSLYSG